MSRRRNKQKGFGDSAQGHYGERDAVSEIARKKLGLNSPATQSDNVPVRPATQSTPRAIVGIDSATEDPKDTEQEAVTPTEPATDSSDQSQLSKVLAEAIGPLQDQLSQLARQNNELATRADQAEKAAATATEELKLAKLEAAAAAKVADAVRATMAGQVGNPNPVAPADQQDAFVRGSEGGPVVVTHRSDEFKTWQRLIDDAPTAPVYAGVGLVCQADHSEALRFYLKNRDAIQESITDISKKAGLLRGAMASNPSRGGRDAATTKSDVPDELLVMLSLELRAPNRSRFIFDQFAYNILELGRSPGYDTIKIAKYGDLAVATSISDYQLTPGTPLTATADPIAERAVACAIEELGRGKNSNVKPIGLATFVSSYTLHDLIAIVNEKLSQNYRSYIDLRIRSLFATATTVLYNAVDEATTDPTEVPTGGGAMTKEFLGHLLVAMQELRVTPYEDGLYAIVLPPRPMGQLLASLSDQERVLMNQGGSGGDLVTEMFRRMTGPAGQIDQLNGYHGIHSGFHIFSSNAYGIGAAGTEGVQTETLGATSTTTYTSYAFGMRPVGHGTALPVELRRDDVTDFGRTHNYIWYSHEGFVGLDINNTPATFEDCRVVKVNTSAKAI